MTTRRFCTLALAGCLALLTRAAGPVRAAENSRSYEQSIDRAVDFLRTKAQNPNGSYTSVPGPGITAVVTYGLLRCGRTADDPVVAKGLKLLETFVQADGGVYTPDTFHKNYETSISLLAFHEANRDGRYKDTIAKAQKFLKGIQWTEATGTQPSDTNYGGAGYGKSKRPDLSNTSFLIDALKAAGSGPDDEAMQKALVFVSRCQNLESGHNTTEFATKNPDGGFYYTPASGGVSFAGKTDKEGLRSYGSMTYAGMKSMLYAGVGPDDPRVKAAYKWIQHNFDVTTNPGMGGEGLYYYYHVFAKALDAIGDDQIVDAKGVKHDWRKELRDELLRRQRPDGSWVNEASRWLEGEPALVTGYALMALSYTRPKP